MQIYINKDTTAYIHYIWKSVEMLKHKTYVIWQQQRVCTVLKL